MMREQNTERQMAIIKMSVLLCLLLVILAPRDAAAAVNNEPPPPAPDCVRLCGNVTVPFPFGLEERCALNSTFQLNCSYASSSDSPPLYAEENILVHNISLETATMVVSIYQAIDCYDANGTQTYLFNQSINLGADWPYTLNTSNKFTVMGCDTVGLMEDYEGTYASACASICNNDTNFDTMATEAACSGNGCCQTPLPKGLKTLDIIISSINNHTNFSQFNPCGLAFVVDPESFNVSELKLPTTDDIGGQKKLVLDWVVDHASCEKARSTSTYACKENSDCQDYDYGEGYRCFCRSGYKGNPYLSGANGCQDIDECQNPENYPCHGRCKNKPGNYTCDCPFGKDGDGKIGCDISHSTIIIAVISLAILCVILASLILFICKRRAKERYFKQNGGEILKHQRVKIFTKAELIKATNNYDDMQKLGEGGFGSVYRGKTPDGKFIAVKKPKDMNKFQVTNEEFHREIQIISQVNHKNLVKLLGICLETKVPLLVYEYIENGTLHHLIHFKRLSILKSWKNRVRIALEAAEALLYLHSFADPPIIHGDVKSMNILLDQKFTTKVSDFGGSVLVLPSQIPIAEKIKGTLGYLDPEYVVTGSLNTKSDVYSFGVILVELLTGKQPTSQFESSNGTNVTVIQSFVSAVEDGRVFNMVNIEAADEGEMWEIDVVASLARKCLYYQGVDRPTMKEVAEQLESINWNLQARGKGDDETQGLLDESGCYPPGTSTGETSKTDVSFLLGFDIEGRSTSST